MQIQSMETDSINDVWPLIEDRVETLLMNQRKEGIKYGDLSPIDVYAGIRDGNRLLMMCLDDYEVLYGFFLLKVITVRGKRALVPHCISLTGFHKFLDLAVRAVKDVGAKYNCDVINVISNKIGWLMWFEPYGFKNAGKEYIDGEEYLIFEYKLRGDV